MRKLWNSNRAAVRKYWSEHELEDIQYKNISKSAKRSSRLDNATGEYQLRNSLQKLGEGTQHQSLTPPSSSPHSASVVTNSDISPTPYSPMSPTTTRPSKKRDRESFESSDHHAAGIQDELNQKYLLKSSNSAHSDDSLDLDETDELVAMITSVRHKDCNLVRSLLFEVHNSVMLAGTFAPWHPTPMMEKVFSKNILKKIRDSLSKKLEPIDDQDADMSILLSIRHRANNKIKEAVEALNGVKDLKLRLLFQQIVEELSAGEQGEMSEETLIANHVSPILRAFTHDPELKIFAHFPNTNSRAQTQQGVKPDRPDFKVVAGNKEVAFGEVTGPSQRNDRNKNGWDLYRLARFGTAVLNQGTEVVPLVQVVAGSGTIYRHIVKDRGVMVLAEVGVFSVPTTTIHMGALLASLPALNWLRDCIKWLDDHSESLIRSWTAADLAQLKKYVQ
ncbi:hypothetical protein BGZ79_003615 [Entomortierella chlamydospora]|nr:hypothetical protein BGZ79_003615 [Entomortierella chlamydospora]